MTQDTAETSLLTLTEQSQNNQLKEEATRSKANLLTQKELLRGSITRFKTNIRNFHLLEENGLSTLNFSLEISSSYDKLRNELEILVTEWSRFIRMAVIVKDPQPTTPADREILKQEIDDENRKIYEYRKMVDELKLENLDVFRKIKNNSKMLQTQGQIRENRLKPEFRPTPLTIETTFPEIKTFLRDFSTYIRSGSDTIDQLPGSIVFEVASNNVDSFWMTMFEGWGFNEETTLQEFIFMVNSVSKNRFSVNNRRLELFGLKQKNEDAIEFLDKVNNLVKNSDWHNITEKEAVFMIFQKGVQCEKSRKVCSEFMKECPEGNIQKLADQLKGVKVSKKPKSNDNCTSCGKAGHLNINCWGTCPACEQTGHRPGTCQLLMQERIKREKNRKRKLKAALHKRKLKRKLNRPQFKLNLPGEEDNSNSSYWTDSLSDGETVIGAQDREDIQENSEEEESFEEVKRVKEVIGDATDQDIISAI